jgi:hypothetical protein
MDTQAAEASLWRTKGKWTMGVKFNATSQARIQNVRSSYLTYHTLSGKTELVECLFQCRGRAFTVPFCYLSRRFGQM